MGCQVEVELCPETFVIEHRMKFAHILIKPTKTLIRTQSFDRELTYLLGNIAPNY